VVPRALVLPERAEQTTATLLPGKYDLGTMGIQLFDLLYKHSSCIRVKTVIVEKGVRPTLRSLQYYRDSFRQMYLHIFEQPMVYYR
jgi:hypothetical protein